MPVWVKLSSTCWVVVTVPLVADVDLEGRFGVPDVEITVL